ncbi:NAD(+)/NADH kinase, partial [Candidatus Bipolaricaulota bacterium]|nr:NAD(+)/NADH kinase [Candidatus Bipolaricaulota bacterium]
MPNNPNVQEADLLLFQGKQSEKADKAKVTIQNWSRKNGITFQQVSNEEDVKQALDESDSETVMLSLGGDGSFLKVADMIAPYLVPVLGVNLGKLGFLSGLNVSELEKGLQELLKGAFTVKELTRL